MAKAVLTEEEAKRVAVAYAPRKFPQQVTPAASAFVAFKSNTEAEGQTTSFRIDRIVAEQTGIADLERVSMEEKVEREALSRLKDLQEQAYQQAYQLGLEEGREKAYQETSEAFAERMSHFDQLIQSFENLKPDLVSFNEAHIVQLAYVMAKKIAMTEIQENKELILQIAKMAIESAQSEEQVTVRLAPSDLEFIEHMKEKLGKDFEKLKKAKLEASESITPGGCIVETNYGDVNATVEQRVEKLWASLAGKLPKVSDTAGE